jgi:CubicO group peptidase (beta-lactamase class C family)
VSTEAAFRAAIDQGVAPGGQLCVSERGKRIIDTAYGVLAPGEAAATVDTIYDLASLTKVLATTYICARMHQDGELSLDEAVGLTTVRNILEHCTGYPAHRRFDQELPAGADGHIWIPQRAAREPFEYEPRTKAVYSDVGFIQLGAWLEQKLGEPLDQAYRREAFGAFFLRDRRAQDVFAPSEPGVRAVVHDENARAMGGVAGHAGLFGRARDVVELGERWLRWAAATETFWSPSTVPGSTRTLGWDRPSPQGSSTGDVWPLDSVGHLAFTGCSLWIAPKRQLVAALVTNRTYLSRDPAPIRQMRRAVYASLWP